MVLPGTATRPDWHTVTVTEVLALPTFRGCEVVAGASSLDRRVRWIHASDLPDIAYWLRGGELILHSGVDDSRVMLAHLIRELAHIGAAGLMISTDAVGLSPAVLTLADDLHFPLITMPDTVRFVDATLEVSRLLMTHELVQERDINSFWAGVADHLHADVSTLLAACTAWMGEPLALYDSHLHCVRAKTPPKCEDPHFPAHLVITSEDRHTLLAGQVVPLATHRILTRAMVSNGRLTGLVAVRPPGPHDGQTDWGPMLTAIAKALNLALEHAFSADMRLHVNATFLADCWTIVRNARRLIVRNASRFTSTRRCDLTNFRGIYGFC